MCSVPTAPRLVAALAATFVAIACSNDAGNGSAVSPSDLVAAPLGGGVHLTWKDRSSDETAFEIERGEGAAAFELLTSVPFDTVVYHDADVSLGRTYRYRLRAKFPDHYSDYSNQAVVELSGNSSGGGGSGTQTVGGSGGYPNGGGSGGMVSPAAGASASGSAGAASPAGAGGSSVSGGGSNSTGGGSLDVSFSRDVAPALVAACGSTTSGCHARDQAVGRNLPQFGPCKVIWFAAVNEPVGAVYSSGPNAGQPTGCEDLDLYHRLTELHSMLCDAPTWEQRPRYVVPGDANASLLYQVIAGDASFGGVCKSLDAPVRRMPLVDPKVLPNGVELTQDKIDRIRDWILQGAKNN